MLIYLSMLDTDEEKSKFEQLYIDYRQLMMKTAMGILHDFGAAEDSVHEAFLKVLNMLQKINISERHKTKNLMVIIVRGTSINLYRKRQNILNNIDDNADIEEIPETSHSIPEATIDEMVSALENIDVENADILMLKYYYDFSGKEISKMLGISHEAVRGRVTRATKKIRENLKIL